MARVERRSCLHVPTRMHFSSCKASRFSPGRSLWIRHVLLQASPRGFGFWPIVSNAGPSLKLIRSRRDTMTKTNSTQRVKIEPLNEQGILLPSRKMLRDSGQEASSPIHETAALETARFKTLAASDSGN